jgi:hypothetical protein
MTRRRWLVTAAVVVVLAVGITIALNSRGSDRGLDGPGAVDVEVAMADFDYLIPAGTGQRLDRGEQVELLPAAIRATVGQTIRIVNRDDRDYLLGPFIVGAGETLTQRFTHAGSFTGTCAVHPSGEIEVVVVGD